MHHAPNRPSWTRPPETRPARLRRLAGDGAALAIGGAMWVVMLAGLFG